MHTPHTATPALIRTVDRDYFSAHEGESSPSTNGQSKILLLLTFLLTTYPYVTLNVCLQDMRVKGQRGMP